MDPSIEQILDLEIRTHKIHALSSNRIHFRLTRSFVVSHLLFYQHQQHNTFFLSCNIKRQHRNHFSTNTVANMENSVELHDVKKEFSEDPVTPKKSAVTPKKRGSAKKVGETDEDGSPAKKQRKQGQAVLSMKSITMSLTLMPPGTQGNCG